MARGRALPVVFDLLLLAVEVGQFRRRVLVRGGVLGRRVRLVAP
jgi:hypothetical protein